MVYLVQLLLLKLLALINLGGYTGYGIGFDGGTTFSYPSGEFGRNVLIFGVDMSKSTHIDNKKRTN